MIRERKMPMDLEAEASVLGGILLRNHVLGLLEDLGPDDFNSGRHQIVFSAMRNLEATATAIDDVTLAAEISRMGKLNPFADGMCTAETGLLAFLTQLMLRVPSVENVVHYASEVRKRRFDREVILAASAIIDDVYTGQVEGEDAIRSAVNYLLSLKTARRDLARSLDELAREELAAIERDCAAMARGEEVLLGMPIGIDKLDDETGGYPLGQVSLVLGGTGHGKSTLLGMGARSAAWWGHVPLVYSFEDSTKFWAQRAIAQETGIPTQAIAARRLADYQVRLAGASAAVARRREIIIPSSGMTAQDVIRDVRARRQQPLPPGAKTVGRLIVIDYLHVMRMSASRNSDKRTEAIADTMDELQGLAQSEDAAVVVGCQVKQEVEREKRAPRKDDVADSYAPTKVSKFILGIHRPGRYDRTLNPLVGEIAVLKRNQGDDLITADVVMELATHTIRCATAQREEPQRQLGLGA